MNKYYINTEEKLFNGLNNFIKPFLPCKILIVTDSNVNKLYSEDLMREIENGIGLGAGTGLLSLFVSAPVFTFVIPAGEKSKNINTVNKIWSFLAEKEFTRNDLIIALGGGVVGDIAGFAAAAYLRGIRYIQIPTTLLAAVDSSIGGKTGIDIPAGKNLVGAFYEPLFTFCDTRIIKDIPERERKNGMGEVIKYQALTGANLVRYYIERDYFKLISECAVIKEKFVNEDFRDNGIRQYLNFGHTLGHVIENHSRYSIQHGRAVAIGMCGITGWAEEKGLTEKGTFEEILSLCKKTGLDTEYGLSADELLKLAVNDKKRRGNILNLVLLKKIGEPYLYENKIL